MIGKLFDGISIFKLFTGVGIIVLGKFNFVIGVGKMCLSISKDENDFSTFGLFLRIN